jgi:hypothetical protein
LGMRAVRETRIRRWSNFYTATSRRCRGATWSIFAPALRERDGFAVLHSMRIVGIMPPDN